MQMTETKLSLQTWYYYSVFEEPKNEDDRWRTADVRHCLFWQTENYGFGEKEI